MNETDGSEPFESEHTDTADTGDENGPILKWVVRCTWEVIRGLSHPKYTYTDCVSETQAIDYAVKMLENYESNSSLRLIEVHVMEPSPSKEWRKVE